jgi:hypothetical protein
MTMLRALPLLLLALPLAACGGGEGTSISINASGGEDGNSSIATDANGQVAINVPGFSGAIKLPKIQINAENFDINGLKLYPKSRISDLKVDAEDKAGDRDQGKVRVAFESPAALATVQGWFRDNLAKQGFKVQPQGNGFAGTTDEGESFALTLDPDGADKIKGRIEVGN